jgi:DNA-directed RNA polymerase subunit RPC12/RpoP
MNYTKQEFCPACGTRWWDKPIPKEYRENYSPPYWYSRVIALYDRDDDATFGYKCPDCDTFFKRK